MLSEKAWWELVANKFQTKSWKLNSCHKQFDISAVVFVGYVRQIRFHRVVDVDAAESRNAFTCCQIPAEEKYVTYGTPIGCDAMVFGGVAFTSAPPNDAFN